jgi:hypothetical protein
MNMTLCAAACLVGCVPLANIGAQTPSTRNSVVDLPISSLLPIMRVSGDGDVAVHNWDRDQVEVRVEDVVTGRVIGYSNEPKRGPYAVSITPTDSGIVIAPRARRTPIAIGFNSVRDHLRHDIYLPAAARICLRLGNGNVLIDGHFASIEISGDELRHAIKVEDRTAGATSSKSSCGVI